MKQRRQEEEEMEEEPSPSFFTTDKVSAHVHVMRLAFSVPEANDRGIVYLHTLVSTLRDNPYLPMLGAKFAKEKVDMLERLPDGSVFMDRDLRIFKHVVTRLRIPDLDMSRVPGGVTEEEWRGELSYWGYRTEEERSSRRPEAPFVAELRTRVSEEAEAVLSVIEFFLKADGLYERLDYTDSVTLWFLDGLVFSTSNRKCPEIAMADWLRKWGSRFHKIFSHRLGLAVTTSSHPKGTRGSRTVSCPWPSSVRQDRYDPNTHGLVELRVCIEIGKSE